MAKITVAYVRALEAMLAKEEITYSRMVEMLNEKAGEIDANNPELCHHLSIVVVTETPTNGVVQQMKKTYVQCEDCNKVLPIQRITKKDINVPLHDFGHL